MGKITPDSIRRAIDATDIVELIGTYVHLKRAGSSFKGLCPFHNEKSPSFTVSPARQTYKCFGCGAGGDALGFLMDFEKLPFLEAIERLAQRASVELEYDGNFDKQAYTRKRDQKHLLTDVMSWAQGRFAKSLKQESEAAEARDYLFHKRGLTQDQVAGWGIGYSLDSYENLLLQGLKEFGEPAVLEEAGLIRTNEQGKRYDFFRGRIMFPIRDAQGNVVAFGARKLREEQSGGKYINSPTTPIYDKSRVLYGIDRLPASTFNRERKGGKKLVLVVEGYLDVIACHAHGFDCAVAPCGTAITPDQLRTLTRYADRVVLLMDADDAGQASMERVAPEIVAQGLDVSVAALPQGKDPDEFFKTHNAATFLKLVEEGVDVFTFKLNALKRRFDLSHPATHRKAVEEALGVIAGSDDAMLRARLVKQTSEFFKLPEADVSQQLALLVSRGRRGSSAMPVNQAVVGVPRLLKWERMVLLRLLVHPELARPLAEFLFPAHFPSAAGGELYRVLCNTIEEHDGLDPLAVLDELRSSEVEEDLANEARRLLMELVEGDVSLRGFEALQAEGKSDGFNLSREVREIETWFQRQFGHLEEHSVSAEGGEAATRLKLEELRRRKGAKA